MNELKQLQLVVHAGPLAGKGFPLTNQPITFGRDDDNTIPLDDEEVSRNHARITREGNKVIIEDLGSTNGTFINGKRITEPHVVQPTDIISVGASVFGVKGFEAAPTVSYAQPSPDPYMATPPVAPPSSKPGNGRKPRPTSAPTSSSWLSGASLLLLGVGFVFVIALLSIMVATVYLMTQSPAVPVASIPTVIITAPVNNSDIQINLPVTVQATASDANGIKRVELWVAGKKIDETTSPSAEGQPTLAASFQWTPDTPGSYSLEVKAYNQLDALNSVPSLVTVKVIDPNQPTSAATTATQTAVTPTTTPTTGSTTPSLLVKTDLNVRTGPDSTYDLLGLLPADSRAEIIGQSESRQWWKIRFAPAGDGTGWVLADPTYSTASNVQNVPIVVSPATNTPTPTHTPTPTNTAVPPTAIRATNTPVPAATATPTNTPTPTPTNTVTLTPELTKIEFDISPKEINLGECSKMVWNITGVKEIYVQEENLAERGIAGTGNVQVCPPTTRTYRLRVIRNDGVEERREVSVIVKNSDVLFASSATIAPNRSIDLETGEDRNRDKVDFLWSVGGNERHFVVANGVKMATMGDTDSLNDVDRDDCNNASYDKYTFIDVSDAPPDPENTLIPGRTICFITNDGHKGKLRFPDYSTSDLKIEWVTWR